MTRKTSSRRVPSNTVIPRDVLLAGIGAVSLGRKQAILTYASAVSSVYSLRDQATAAASLANARLRSLRNKTRSRVTPVARKAVELISQLRSQAEAQLQPVLGKFGRVAKAKPARSKRKPAPVVRKTTARARKAA